ncbi:ABC transporter substrate-binding protein [Metabacillus herbersteinensis]
MVKQTFVQVDEALLIKPLGTINVVDPSPFNWLYILFNTMEEAVRADFDGRVIPSLAASYQWVDETTLEMKLRKDAQFHNSELFSALNVKQNFDELQRWFAPHPPGTWLNFPKETTLEVVDNFTVRFHFPKRDGLALGKMRGNHFANLQFWQQLGFGYAKIGTAEGHW